MEERLELGVIQVMEKADVMEFARNNNMTVRQVVNKFKQMEEEGLCTDVRYFSNDCAITFEFTEAGLARTLRNLNRL